MGNSKQMEYCISRTTHSNIQRHCIQKSFTRCYTSRQYTFIAFFIIFKGILYYQFCCIFKELLAVLMCSHNGTIPW